MHTPGPTLQCVLPPGEYDRRYQPDTISQAMSPFAKITHSTYGDLMLLLSTIRTIIAVTEVKQKYKTKTVVMQTERITYRKANELLQRCVFKLCIPLSSRNQECLFWAKIKVAIHSLDIPFC